MPKPKNQTAHAIELILKISIEKEKLERTIKECRDHAFEIRRKTMEALDSVHNISVEEEEMLFI